jgi:hypothetical protein
VKPELSRRIAWVTQLLKMTPKQQTQLVVVAEAAKDFENLPTEIQDLILAVEKKVGANPNL